MKPQGLTSVPGSCAFRLMQLQLAIFILLTICGTDNKEGSPGGGGGVKLFFFLSFSNALKNLEQRDMKLELCRAAREWKSNQRPLNFPLI